MQKYVSQVTFYDYPLTSWQKINKKKEAGTKVLAYQLSLDYRARRSG